jgi:hypothetical protein
MTYQEKYLKYKKKYNNLKKQYGGVWQYNDNMINVPLIGARALDEASMRYSLSSKHPTQQTINGYNIKYDDGIWSIKLTNEPIYKDVTNVRNVISRKEIQDSTRVMEQTITYPNGDIYTGTVTNGMKNGQGRLEYNNGDVYEGNFENDMKHGHGIMRYYNGVYEDTLENDWLDRINEKKPGDIYNGMFKDDMMNGYGEMEYKNGEEYHGMFKNNMKHGYGEIEYFSTETKYYKNGYKKHFSGMFKDDMINGMGKMEFKHSVYEGMFKDNMMNGKGTMTYNNGDIYEGMFKNDMMNGMGIIRYSHEDIYEGMLKDYMRNGKGTMRYTDGNIYEGTFKNDMRDGIGTLKYNNGDIYKGMFKDNMRNGQGKEEHTTGDIYEGIFKDNMRNGMGILKHSDGTIEQGVFTDSGLNGEGTYTYTDGTTYKHTFKDGNVVIDIKEPDYDFDNNDTDDDEDYYELVIFIASHGCDMKDTKIKLPINFKNHMSSKYIAATTHGCANYGNASVDINSAYMIFNTDETTHEQIINYKIMRRGKISYNKPTYNHMYKFSATDEPPENQQYYGIFIIKNDLFLPNNINLFDWDNPDYVNNYNERIELLSSKLTSLFKKSEDGTLVLLSPIFLSYILKVFYEWKQSDIIFEGTDKKLKLIVIDNSCRINCKRV